RSILQSFLAKWIVFLRSPFFRGSLSFWSRAHKHIRRRSAPIGNAGLDAVEGNSVEAKKLASVEESVISSVWAKGRIGSTSSNVAVKDFVCLAGRAELRCRQ